MRICRSASKDELALAAALAGAERIRKALHEKGHATIVLATGMSQAGMLSHLAAENLDWGSVTAFHLDEYIGIRATHPASFRKYLQERFLRHVKLRAFHAIQGEKEPIAEVKRLNRLIGNVDIDVAFVGIGENGHLAFNDPPANLDTTLPYLLVKLDEACRSQQVGEGWFKSLREVPPSAITMSIRQIQKAEHIICTVPELRKAKAVQASVEGEITPAVPASYLQEHSRAEVYVDPDSSSLLGPSRDPVVIEAPKLGELRSLRAGTEHFHLFVAADFSRIKDPELGEFAERALDAGAVTVTCWGKASSAMELAFDGMCVKRGLQTGISETAGKVVMTMSYKPEDLEEALFMFLDSIAPAEHYKESCKSAIAVVVGKPPKRDQLLQHLTHPGEFIDAYVSADDEEAQ
ncbi:MAG TPA: glucosamine-6-phosphate deaminase [Planctomycetota bacterium]|nr:glucosamine-6-phosphate deaminase [Planctomycetota bacterium]